MTNVLEGEIMDYPLLETLADISYIAGVKNYYSGSSREDISTFIWWAKEFQKIHSQTNWNESLLDYILTIEEYTEKKINESNFEISKNKLGTNSLIDF
ncbi:MAG: hypothetical protein L6Q78_10830 [Bacteroidia bacterium]|nr:hypothetical protein [Bacteroidia bacterium]